jgi:hypothetical protein
VWLAEGMCREEDDENDNGRTKNGKGWERNGFQWPLRVFWHFWHIFESLAKLNKGPVLYDQCFAMPLDLLDLDLDDYIDDNHIHTTP